MTFVELWGWGLGLIAVAVVSSIAGYLQVRRGLTGIEGVRERLAAVREGRASRLGGALPSEVQPLADDLDALLEHRARTVERASHRAADLAHGLKTPIAVLFQEIERAEAAGQAQLAATLRHELRRIERQIDLHLAQARAAGAGARLGTRCRVLEAAEGLGRTLERLHAERRLGLEPWDLELRIDPALAVRAELGDLEEMLGNLMDNAFKWGDRRVVVAAERRGEEVALSVDDDGPGVSPDLRGPVLRRGVRADEAAPGTGLGLAIARELAELHGGDLGLEASSLGGLRAVLTLPAA